VFRKAVKSQAKARIGIIGPSGSGKTYTALKIASELGEKIAVIDTEYGSASKYADEFDFDVCELNNYDPRNYTKAIQSAGQAGYDVIIIDSLSHAWSGEGGVLEMADKLKAKYRGNKFAAWADVTPLHNQLVHAMLRSPAHLIATLRSKMEYIQTEDDKGKTVIKKVGMAPIQRDGMEYEFDIVGDMDLEHNFIISKTRCRALDGAVINKPGEELAKTIKDWLTDGAPAPQQPVAAPPAPKQPETPPRAKAAPPPSNGKSNDGNLAGISTAPQQKKIHIYAKKKGYKADALIRERFGIESGSTKDLTKQQASDLISWLMEAPPAQAKDQMPLSGLKPEDLKSEEVEPDWKHGFGSDEMPF
jgi:hypothetical protein